MVRGGVFLGALVSMVFAAAVSGGAEESRPMTGREIDGMTCVDRLVNEFMTKWNLPGGAVGIVKDGRLVYSRGFGLADVEEKQPAEPDDLFRIASISKPITATMIMKLVEAGKLSPDDTVWSHLDDWRPLPEDARINPEFKKITIRHCLQHAGGFDRDKSFDPMFMPEPLMKLTDSPAEATTIIRFMLTRPLDFRPGKKYAYSNFGYCLLGRIIERVTGQTYEEAVRQAVLEPIGARRTRLGKTPLADRLADEVLYYGPPGTKPGGSVFPNVKEKVEPPYGAFYIEAMDAHGGWVSSTSDLLRLVASLDGTRKPRILKTESVRRMIEDCIPRDGASYAFYGYGWAVSPAKLGDKKVKLEASDWSHTGSLDGTATILVRSHRGVSWAALFNSRAGAKEFYPEMDRTLWKAVEQVRSWPDHDLFADGS